MAGWWGQLSQMARFFFGLAAFFSAFFIWQLIAALTGLGGDEVDGDVDVDADVDAGADADVDAGDAIDTVASFRLLSIRSIVTFFTLFSWGCALYLARGDSPGRAMGYSVLWGAAGMVAVAGILGLLPRMTHTGTRNLASCQGETGRVYLDIPANGIGEVRVMVSGRLSFVKARARGGAALPAGTPVKVIRCLDQTLVEVEENK